MSSSNRVAPTAVSAASASLLPSSADCLRAACDEVRALFRTPESLSRLPLYCSEYATKRDECRHELSQAIAQQIDDTRQAVQQLKAAVSSQPVHNTAQYNSEQPAYTTTMHPASTSAAAYCSLP